MLMKFRLRNVAIIAALFLTSCARTPPDSEQLSQLQQDVKELRTEVRSLTDEVQRLQNGTVHSAASDSPRRNPFGVPDVLDPDGADVKRLAVAIDYLGSANDPNAEQWAAVKTAGDPASIDGEWSGRWNNNNQSWVPSYTATVKTVGDRVYILYRDHQGRFLADLHREKDLLVGRLTGVDNPADTNPCVIRIVSPERFDGSWGGHGRLDFRRRF